MTTAKTDLTGYTNFNFLSPKVFTGPTDEILQKKVDFTTKQFGATTEKIQIDTSPIGWIKNMTLRIELNALTTEAVETSQGGTGYINWVDSIGHALIESINLKLGNTTIFDSIFPYGLWLDIYNELNDPDMLEWGMIGKHSSIDGLKKYETKKKVLYVPLHLWFSESLDAALPYFLFPNKESGLQISIQLRRFKDLVLFSSANSLPTEPPNGINKLQLIYDIIQVPDDKLASLKAQYRKIPYQIYFNHKDFYERSLSSIINLNFDSAPISKLIFVIRNNSRIASDDTPQINEHHSDLNGNDIFNYGNTSLITNLGTYDNFETLNINTQNETDDHDLDSIYYRKVTNMNNGKHVPQKHIYTVPFDYGTKGNSFFGFLDYKIQDTLQFEFEENASNSTISTFAITCNKLEIDRNGRTNLNNWYNNRLQVSSMSGSGLSEDALYKRIYEKLYNEIFEKISSQLTLPICETIPTGTTIGRKTYMDNDKLLIVLDKNETNWTVLVTINSNDPNFIFNEYIENLKNEYVVFKEQDESQIYKISNIELNNGEVTNLYIFMLALLISKSGSSKFIDQFFIDLLKTYGNIQSPKDIFIKGFTTILKNKTYKNMPIFKDIDLEDTSQIEKILFNNLCYESVIKNNLDTTETSDDSILSILSPLLVKTAESLINPRVYTITVEKMDSLVNLVGTTTKSITTKSITNETITNETINEYMRLRTKKLEDYNKADENNPALFKVDNFLRNSFLYVENKLSIETKLAQLKQIELNQGNIGPTRSPFTLSPKSQNFITLTFYLDNYPFKGIPSFVKIEEFYNSKDEDLLIKTYLDKTQNQTLLAKYNGYQDKIDQINEKMKNITNQNIQQKLQEEINTINTNLKEITQKCKDQIQNNIVSKYHPYLKKRIYKGSTINYLSIIKDFIEVYKKIYLEHSQYKGYKACSDSLKILILNNIKDQIKDLRTFINSKGTTTTPTGTTPAPPLIPNIILSNTTDIQLNISESIDEWLNKNSETNNNLYFDKNNGEFSVSTTKPIITTTTTTNAPFTTDNPNDYDWFPTTTQTQAINNSIPFDM